MSESGYVIVEGLLREWAEEEMAAEKAALLRLVAAIIDGQVTVVSDTPHNEDHNEMTLVYRTV